MTDIDTLAATVRQRCDADEQAARDRWNRDGVTSERFHGTPYDPTRVLEGIRRTRVLASWLTAEPHATFPRRWFGRAWCDRLPGPCTCDRDRRVAGYLELLAQPHEEAAE